MDNIVKFSGMILFSVLAFAGVFLLKNLLTQTLPHKANLVAMLQTMPQLALKWRFWVSISCYAAALIVYLFLLHNDEVSKIFSMVISFEFSFTHTCLLKSTL